MPYFVFRGSDRPGTEALRQSIREEHRAYIRQERYGCRVVAGGPLVADEGAPMFGTLLVLEAPDRTSALRYLADDPYCQASLFAETELHRWQWGLGQPSAAP